MIVRKMTPLEFDSVINLSKYYISEAELDDSWNEDTWLEYVKRTATKWDCFFFVAFDNQRPVGWISGSATTKYEWNPNINANVQTVYLLKSHRTSENTKLLFDSFLEWAHLINAKTISCAQHEIEYFNARCDNDGMKTFNYYIKEL